MRAIAMDAASVAPINTGNATLPMLPDRRRYVNNTIPQNPTQSAMTFDIGTRADKAVQDFFFGLRTLNMAMLARSFMRTHLIRVATNSWPFGLTTR